MENLVILEILYSFPLNTVVCIWLAGHFEAGLPCISFQVKFFSFLKKKKKVCVLISNTKMIFKHC